MQGYFKLVPDWCECPLVAVQHLLTKHHLKWGQFLYSESTIKSEWEHGRWVQLRGLVSSAVLKWTKVLEVPHMSLVGWMKSNKNFMWALFLYPKIFLYTYIYIFFFSCEVWLKNHSGSSLLTWVLSRKSLPLGTECLGWFYMLCMKESSNPDPLWQQSLHTAHEQYRLCPKSAGFLHILNRQ